MRPGQNKRMRGRPNNNGGNRKGPNPLTRSYESNGPDVKIRGNAHHVAEKYLQLARDAQSSGDPVAAESYLQHAEHYFRLIASAQAAQAGYARQPDAVDTEVDEDDDSGIPDRFASPQAPAPFVPQPAAQPYQGERQPYTGERQPYGGQQGQGGERQAYGNRQDDRQNGERQPYNDRNGYNRQDRQDRNGQRRNYRDNAGGEIRTDDRQAGQAGQDQRQDRPYGETRMSRRERFALERQERMERNGQDRGFDRSREGGERYGSAEPSSEQLADFGTGDQPRIAAEPVQRPETQAEPVRQPEPIPAEEVRSEAPARAEAPQRRERAERATPTAVEDAPGLPSFITSPTRVVPAAEAPEPSLATATAFPGDDAEEAPKFPRRRRRTSRAAAAPEGEAPAVATDLPATGD